VAGFSLGFILLLLGFILPPNDGLGLVIDPTVFHESFLVGGLGRCLNIILKLNYTRNPLSGCSLVLACIIFLATMYQTVHRMSFCGFFLFKRPIFS
jgi:hypothetical protein